MDFMVFMVEKCCTGAVQLSEDYYRGLLSRTSSLGKKEDEAKRTTGGCKPGSVSPRYPARGPDGAMHVIYLSAVLPRSL